MRACSTPRSTSYRAGDAEAAAETVGDAYLEHFEHVEAPLGDRDHELMEEIEHALATEIRDAIKAEQAGGRDRGSGGRGEDGPRRAVVVLEG